MPQTVNYHHYGKDPAKLTAEFGDNWMYVGRENRGLNIARSPLANPFVNSSRANGRVVSDPVRAYRRWLWQQAVKGNTAVLKALSQINEETSLVCWCAPQPCHADMITSAWHYLAHDQYTEVLDEVPTLALSIRQPWAWLITRPDVTDPWERGQMYLNGQLKCVENRTWATGVRGEIFIHAAKTLDTTSVDYVLQRWPNILLPDEYELGGIVGRAKLVECVEGHGSQWSVSGQKQFVLMGTRPLPFVACPGQLKFFDVSEVMNVSS